MFDTRSGSLSDSVVRDFNFRSSHLKFRQLLYLDHFNVLSLIRADKQACLALKMDSPTIDVCCVDETRTRDLSSAIQPSEPNISSRYFLSPSGKESARAARQRGVGMVLTEKAEAALSD